MSDRTALARAFLQRTGWSAARQRTLAGDASARRYWRLSKVGGTAILMDAPPDRAEPVADFRRIANHLRALGLSAPEVLAEDTVHGFLLLEDLGDALYDRSLMRDPGRETEAYAAAADVLAHLQAHPAAPDLPVYDAPKLAEFVSPLADSYAGCPAAPLVEATEEAMHRLVGHTDTMILRDYHAENLLWLPARKGLARVGLLDFQQAMLCHPAYDLVSLLQDARRDVAPAVEEATLVRFVAATGAAPDAFRAAYAALGAQRNLRIVGQFARLALTAGKTRYLAMIPRVWALALRDLAHPELADLAAIVTKLVPAPTPETLQRIAARCSQAPKP